MEKAWTPKGSEQNSEETWIANARHKKGCKKAKRAQKFVKIEQIM